MECLQVETSFSQIILWTLLNSLLFVRGTMQEEALNSWGWTALHYAAWHNKIQMVELLLCHGATVDAKDSEASRQDAAYIARFHHMAAAGQASWFSTWCVCAGCNAAGFSSMHKLYSIG